jgi:phosphodiesterase/alkaline phosphatase D-like protein
MAVTSAWSGRQGDDGFQVVFKLDGVAASCRLVVSTTDFGTPTFGSPATPDADRYVRVSIPGLTADTLYFYRLEIDGSVDASFTGECRTLPPSGEPANFTIAAGTCIDDASNSVVFDSIVDRHPLLFLLGGDKHYANIAENDVSLHLAAHEVQLAMPRQKEWHRLCPVYYTWDDHDFCGNGSDGTFAGRFAANLAYRQIVPHFDLPASNGIGIWNTFDVGLVRIINTDTRSRRTPNNAVDGRGKSMLGFEQRDWFFEVLQDAVDVGIRAIVWNNSMQWSIEEPGGVDPSDTWRVFAYERALIGRYMKKIGCPPVVIVSGDAHELATRLRYEMGGFPFAIFQNAAMSAGENSRGGYWDYGPRGGSRHFGMLEFTDNGDDVLTVNYQAIEVSPSGATDTVMWNPVIDLEARRRLPSTSSHHSQRRMPV